MASTRHRQIRIHYEYQLDEMSEGGTCEQKWDPTPAHSTI